MSPMYKLRATQLCFSAAGAEFNLSAAFSMLCILGNGAKREKRNHCYLLEQCNRKQKLNQELNHKCKP